jgi:hypothetical protein
MVTLLPPDGRTLSEDEFFFDPETYHFTLANDEDVTNLIRQADKIRMIPDFDQNEDLRRLSAERAARGGTSAVNSGAPTPMGPASREELDESTASIFVGQILHDPLAAPIQTLDSTVDQVFASSGVKKLVVVAALIVAAAIYFKNN